jgi:gamma-glutamyl:cysteine ligase YbdK (ATP-grasp superfamily)
MYVFFWGGKSKGHHSANKLIGRNLPKKPGALVIYGKFKEASRTLNDWGMRIIKNKQQIYTYI